MSSLVQPQLAIPTEKEALSFVNRWLHRKIGMALHSTKATFDPVSFYWHLPVELAYPDRGTIGTIGDLYLQAITGSFAGIPDPEELKNRAESLSTLQGIE
ncbi:MAG: hypothetical protein HY774_27450 [Acidobacteria bacterium]|nr:hypothetical protein [Acidobacteriota bacterium]